MTAVVVACLPSFRILLSARVRSRSSYKRRNASSEHSSNQIRSTNSRGSVIRMKAIRSGTYFDAESRVRASTEGGGPPNTVISTSSKTESQEEILPTIPKDRILKRQDMVSRQPSGLASSRADNMPIE